VPGTDTEVPMLRRSPTVEVAPGTRPDTALRLRGNGLTNWAQR